MTESRKSLQDNAGTVREPFQAIGSRNQFPAGQEPPLRGFRQPNGEVQPATAWLIGGVLGLLAATALFGARVATANPYGMTDDEFLDCLGPSWSTMTRAEREEYGPDAPDLPHRSAA